MNRETAIKLFEHQRIRVEWDEATQKWYFAIVDVIGVLTGSPKPRTYWSVLKTRLKKEGSQLATNCSQLKMKAADGKYYLTDVADTEQLARATFGVTPLEHKALKGLSRKNENLRDHMTDLELIFTMLGERVTTEISQAEKPETFEKSKKVARRGGGVAGTARRETEKELGKSVLSKQNYLPKNHREPEDD